MWGNVLHFRYACYTTLAALELDGVPTPCTVTLTATCAVAGDPTRNGTYTIGYEYVPNDLYDAAMTYGNVSNVDPVGLQQTRCYTYEWVAVGLNASQPVDLAIGESRCRKL